MKNVVFNYNTKEVLNGSIFISSQTFGPLCSCQVYINMSFTKTVNS